MKYIHIIKPNIKNIYIKIDKDSNIILTSSQKDRKRAEEFIKIKKEWIKKAIKKQQNRSKKDNIVKDGGVVFYLGDSYSLKFDKINKNQLLFNGVIFIFKGNSQQKCKMKIDDFYKQMAKELIPQRVEYFSKRLSLFPKEIKFRKMKRRLGSCSMDNILTFNTLCLKLSLEEVDYIVIHELCHIKHKNHSKEFWREVSRFCPDYKKIRERISI